MPTWADIASEGGFGVIAIVHRDGVPEEVAGEAGYAMRDDGDGDLAVTVAPDWRGWLGPYLLDVLVRHAAAAGLANLQAEVLLENGPMLSLLSRRGPVALAHDSGVVRLSIGTAGRCRRGRPPRIGPACSSRSPAGGGRASLQRRPRVSQRRCVPDPPCAATTNVPC